MDFLSKNNNIVVESDKKEITLDRTNIVVDGMMIEMAGEYEKSGFLVYAHEQDGRRIYAFRAEGNRIAYIPEGITTLEESELDFLGEVDILVISGGKTLIPLLEKIEPRMIVLSGDSSYELAMHLGVTEPPVAKHKFKESDLSSDKTLCVYLAS